MTEQLPMGDAAGIAEVKSLGQELVQSYRRPVELYRRNMATRGQRRCEVAAALSSGLCLTTSVARRSVVLC